jgi:hypothetical protein
MSIQINTIRTHCTLCKDFTPPTGELTGYVSSATEDKWSQSAKNCTGCQFIVAVISAANSLGISGPYNNIFIDGSQGTVPRFTMNCWDWDGVYGGVQVCALQGILELYSVYLPVTNSGN